MLGNYFHQTKLEPIFFPLRLAFLSALPVHKMNFHYYVSIHEQIRLFFGSLVTTADKFNATNCTVFNTDTCCTNLQAPFWVFLYVLVIGTELHVVFMHLYRTVMLKSWTSWHSCK